MKISHNRTESNTMNTSTQSNETLTFVQSYLLSLNNDQFNSFVQNFMGVDTRYVTDRHPMVLSDLVVDMIQEEGIEGADDIRAFIQQYIDERYL